MFTLVPDVRGPSHTTFRWFCRVCARAAVGDTRFCERGVLDAGQRGQGLMYADAGYHQGDGEKNGGGRLDAL